ncbi:MAG: hypothetical protein J7599_24205 [Niabella sp.]|nr:hypothetical protein [Niabella sp.]
MVELIRNNKTIECISVTDLHAAKSLSLNNCVIETINLIGAFELNTSITIENSIINNLLIHSCWFVNGLSVKNCIILNRVDYQMGGHNQKEINIVGNIFNNFFDCHFEKAVFVQKNIFVQGTNLLGNLDQSYFNTFENGIINTDNIGAINLNIT